MAKRKRPYMEWEGPIEDAPPCAVNGCGEPGLYKAPKSSHQLREYYWFCMPHVREYNQAWNFFDGMPPSDVEHFMKESVTGHRPTWKIGTHAFYSRDVLEDAMARMMGEARANKKTAHLYYPLTTKEKRALAVLELDYPLSLKELKTQYKKLVKRYHPDVNKGDREAEEMFKKVSTAYQLLEKKIKSEPLHT